VPHSGRFDQIAGFASAAGPTGDVI